MHTEDHPPVLACRTRTFDFRERPFVMGILNVTPDSFSDGGQYAEKDRAVARGLEMAAQGADIIDIGGESSRPGAVPVPLAEELRRTIPVIRELASKTTVPISVDTTKAAVAEQALDAGAQIVNDISALRFDPAMGTVIAARRVPVVLMHMRGTPRTMQQNVRYHALMDEVRAFLQERIRAACTMGIAEDRIVIDPGIGFGKSVGQDNFTILNGLGSLRPLGRPILVGPSRKAFIGSLLGAEVSDREAGTAAAVAIAVRNGAHIVRVHDVRMMSMAARVAHAISTASG